MKFDKQFKPWLCARTDGRPMLTTALVRRTGKNPELGTSGIIVCINGFCLVVVPCMVEAEDIEGPILAEVLKQASKVKGTVKAEVSIGLGATEVVLENGVKMPRLNADTEGGSFPDYELIIPKTRSTTAPASFPVSPVLLGKVMEALGPEPIVFTSSGRYAPVMVETCPPINRQPVPPFGLLMPMRLQGEPADFQWDEVPEESPTPDQEP